MAVADLVGAELTRTDLARAETEVGAERTQPARHAAALTTVPAGPVGVDAVWIGTASDCPVRCRGHPGLDEHRRKARLLADDVDHATLPGHAPTALLALPPLDHARLTRGQALPRLTRRRMRARLLLAVGTAVATGTALRRLASR